MLFWNLLTLLLLLMTLCGMLTQSKKLHNFYYWLAVFILVLVSVLRFDIGRDYMQYWNMVPIEESFVDIVAGTRGGQETDRLEFFGRLFYGITTLCEWPPLFFIMIGSVIYFCSFYSIYKNTKYPFMGFWLYWCLLYLYSLNGLRQAAAMAIILFAYPYIRDRKFLNYTFFVILAALFHKSALLAIIFYPLYHYFSLKLTFICCVILIFASNFVVQFLFSNFYDMYLGRIHGYYEGGDNRKWLQFSACFLVYLWQIIAGGLTEEQKKLLSILLFGGIMPFVFGSHFGIRISLYFFAFATIFFADYIPVKKLKTPYQFVVIILLASYTLVCIEVSKYNVIDDDFVPYKSIFSSEINDK